MFLMNFESARTLDVAAKLGIVPNRPEGMNDDAYTRAVSKWVKTKWM